MKFGKTITSHQVPEWSQHYTNYKELKKQIKEITKTQNRLVNEEHISLKDSLNNNQVLNSLSNFFFILDRNIEKVDDFYNKQYSEYDRRLKKISSIINSFNGFIKELNVEEVEEIIGVLIELRSNFRNLKWFGELNKRAFIKILKKLDKKIGTNQQIVYLNSRVFPLSFANEVEIVKNLSVINEYLNKLSPHINQNKLTNSHNGSSSGNSSSSGFKNGSSVNSDKFIRFIEKDDDEGLFNQLIAEYSSIVLIPNKLLISILNKSALMKSTKSITKLLTILPSLSDPSDISGRNFFHHHVISLGKRIEGDINYTNLSFLNQDNRFNLTPATPPESKTRLIGAFGSDGINSHDSPFSLLFILQNLPPHLRSALLQKDNYKRTPLHYAAQYGLREITIIIIDFLKTWGEWDSTISIDDLSHWSDGELLSPLHLAILGAHPKTVEVLVNSCDKSLKCSNLILLATRLNSPEILHQLLECKGIDVNFKDPDTNETALYLSCKLNYIETAKFLLNNKSDTEIEENSFGWTPIFIASVEGLKDIVLLLKEFGANYDKVDESGWTPCEHACLRGFLEIADLLKPNNTDLLNFKVESTNSFENERKSVKPKEEILKSIKRSPSPGPTPPKQGIKSFGHKFLINESLILITLGSNDTRRDSIPAIELNRVPISRFHTTELDTALSLVISKKHSNKFIHHGNSPIVETDEVEEEPIVIDLPIDEVEPISIESKNPYEEIIFFDIIPTYGSFENKKILGRGVALLNNIYTQVGDKRSSLNKNIKIPIIENESLEFLGNLNIEILIVNPFSHSNINLNRRETYWKSLVSTRVIGHRGLGKNNKSRNSLQLGENTVESFIAAASLGASYVEFDVQLTKDHVPVVYHDFSVAETGIDIAMHELTSEQFLSLNMKEEKKEKEEQEEKKVRPRSASYHELNDFRMSEMNDSLEKMKLTKTYKSHGFKGNSRGNSIASSFVTLKELFKKIPENVGFNIECKYPLLYESQVEDLGEISVDLNFWVDTVLKIVFDEGKQRDIIFSSFHPEVCLMLSLKQPSIPILFLTESGTNYMPDVRTNSLKSAIKFAKKWNLLGLVSACEPLIKCPRLIQVIKASGLVCFSYGVLNNDPKNVKLQMSAGVDAVIVDNVLAVGKGLRGLE